MEESYRERDGKMPHIMSAVRGTGALLKAIFRQNPKKLGDWGFDIDDSSPIKKMDL